MTTGADKTLDQLLDEIVKPLQQKQTGVFFVATSDNASCRFAINSGRLTHCTFQRLHGSDALQAFINNVSSGRCSFSESMRAPFRDQDALDPDAAMKIPGIAARLQQTPPPPAASETDSAAPAQTRQRLYRGNVIEDTAPPAPKPGKRIYRGVVSEEIPPPKTAKPTKKRYYRGNLIED